MDLQNWDPALVAPLLARPTIAAAALEDLAEYLVYAAGDAWPVDVERLAACARCVVVAHGAPAVGVIVVPRRLAGAARTQAVAAEVVARELARRARGALTPGDIFFLAAAVLVPRRAVRPGHYARQCTVAAPWV